MLANTPPMLEAHYGVPMTGAVLHSINTRLDAAIVAFQLDHAESKVVICDREFAPVMREALALAKVKPLVIDYDDREFPQAGPPLSGIDYEAFLADGDPDFRWRMPADEWEAHRAQLHLGHHGQSEGRRLSPPRRAPDVLRQRGRRRHGHAPGVPVDAADVPLQRLVLSRGRCRPSPARTCACAGCAPKPCTTAIAEHRVTHLCGAPIVMSTLLNATPREKRPLPHKVQFVTAAAPPPEAVLAAWPRPASTSPTSTV